MVDLPYLKAKLLARRDALIFVTVATAVCLGYAFYTQHIWEDYFITFRFSKNLVEGRGLAYNASERVHGFTSPLGVLLPAFFYWILGQTSYLPALWAFRIASIAAFVGAGLMVLKALGQNSPQYRLIRCAFGLLFILQVKAVAFSVNGMETAFLLFFLAWAIWLFAAPGPSRWLAQGCCWAGLLWTRPDGCVYIIALALGQLAFDGKDRKALLCAQLKSLLVAAPLYLPWVAWTWWYYGSPVPQTVVAKGFAGEGPIDVLGFLLRMWNEWPLKAAQVFYPFYFSGEPRWITTLSFILAFFCLFYWLLPVDDRLGRFASLCFAVLCFYFAYMPTLFPWYTPPAGLCALIVLSRGVFTLARAIVRFRLLAPGFALGTLGILCCLTGYVFAITARTMRIQEKEIEMGNRATVGRWLGEHVRSSETVYLEPAGYIGYFSNAHIIDWPGLLSPQVVQLRRDRQLNFYSMVGQLQSDWVVLRGREVDAMLQNEPYFKKNYSLVQGFDATARLQKYGYIFNAEYLLFDSSYWVYRKKGLEPNTAGAGDAYAGAQEP
jgi:hypothetical protein